ncbi:hypothetical protein C7167_12325 [Salmonella enterica]|nr:hypothetical protein [Salmonella enterica]
MMKKSLCCALLLTASFSTFAAAKTEQQIADYITGPVRAISAEPFVYDFLICACISCTEVTFSVASALSAIVVAKPPFSVVS